MKRSVQVSIFFALLPVGLLWGQTQVGGSNSPIWYNGDNVGIGTSVPVSSLQVVTGATQTNATFGTAANGAFDILALSLDGGVAGYADLGSNLFYSGNWNLRSTSSDGWLLALNTGNSSGFGVYYAASGSNPVSLQNYLHISPNGNVGIGTTSPQHTLGVNGSIGAQSITVASSGADYVFDPAYRLQPLSEIASVIEQNNKRLEQQNHELQERVARLEAHTSARANHASPIRNREQ